MRQVAAHYEHHVELPLVELPGGRVEVIAGEVLGRRSPAMAYSPMVGAALTVKRAMELSLDAGFEHAVVVVDGELSAEGQELERDTLYYMGMGRSALGLRSRAGGRAILIGGAAFGETILMWWNFVARTAEEMSAVRADWEAHRRFGEVTAYKGPRIPAPELVRLRVSKNNKRR
ncbi:MAG: pirin-like C-terminal cupin domain-containing protein [Candidatus Solibacter sp.]